MRELIIGYLIIGQLLLLFGLFFAPHGKWLELTGHDRVAHLLAIITFICVWPLIIFFFKKNHGRS